VEWVGTRGLAYLEVWVVGRELALSGKTQSWGIGKLSWLHNWQIITTNQEIMWPN
jgi:hypothetical protein